MREDKVRTIVRFWTRVTQTHQGAVNMCSLEYLMDTFNAGCTLIVDRLTHQFSRRNNRYFTIHHETVVYINMAL